MSAMVDRCPGNWKRTSSYQRQRLTWIHHSYERFTLVI
jgi:hypothetical protein